MYGLQQGENTAADVFDLVHPDDLDGLLAALRLSGPDHSVTQNLRVIQADGSVKHLHMNTTELTIPGQPDALRLTAVQETTNPTKP